MAPRASAQLVPDGTLGPESSIVVPAVEINGTDSDRIDGGALRGGNLFHSFEEFNIDNGRGAYFTNPPGVENILTRVTGNNPSNLLGTLGILGDADLFFINPNGIVFGTNARLDLGGSFLASTADSFVFDSGFEFSSSNLQAPPLLITDLPIGLRFRDNPGSIINRSQPGLALEPGNSFAFVGGDLLFDNGGAIVPGGAIALASLVSGEVGIDIADGRIAIADFDVLNAGNISFSGDAIVSSSGDRSGTIHIRGGDVRLRDRSRIESVTQNENGGDIVVESNNLSLRQRSVILTGTEGAGNGGNLTIDGRNAIDLIGMGETLDFVENILLLVFQLSDLGNSTDNIDLDTIGVNLNAIGSFDSGLYSVTVASGEGGDLSIQTPDLNIRDSMMVGAFTILGSGRGGDISLLVPGYIRIIGNAEEFSANFFSTSILRTQEVNEVRNDLLAAISAGVFSVNLGSHANSGDSTIVSEVLIVQKGSSIANFSIFGVGDTGDLNIHLTEELDLEYRTNVISLAFGAADAGNVQISAPQISLIARSDIGTGTVGSGNAGNVNIITDRLLVGSNSIVSGSASINIVENDMLVLGSESAGSLTISAADSIELIDKGSLFAQSRGESDAGNITINTQRFVIQAGGSTQGGISTATLGPGVGGNVTINATESVEFIGFIDDRVPKLPFALENILQLLSEERQRFIGIATVSLTGGDGGDVTINTRRLEVRDRAGIVTSTLGTGRSGQIIVNAEESILIDGTSALATLTLGEGEAGELSLTTETLELVNGGLISVDTLFVENLAIVIDLVNNFRQSFDPGRVGAGNASDITIIADRVELSGGARISAATGNNTTGVGGTVTIVARDSVDITGDSINANISSNISAETNGAGNAGNLVLQTSSFSIRDGGRIIVSGTSSGSAGNIDIDADSTRLDRGTIASETRSGQGNINLRSQDLVMNDRSNITTNAFADAPSGNINIDTGVLVGIDNSDITTNAERGQAGQIQVTADGILGIRLRTRSELQQLLGSENLSVVSPNFLDTSDITAISVQDAQLDGQTIFNTPDVDSTEGILELPENVVDPSELVSQNPCIQGGNSEFTDIGRGGLPVNPEELATSSNIEAEWIDPVEPTEPPSPPAAIVLEDEEIIPARGWVFFEDGTVRLTSHLTPETQPMGGSREASNEAAAHCIGSRSVSTLGREGR